MTWPRQCKRLFGDGPHQRLQVEGSEVYANGVAKLVHRVVR